MDLQSTLLEAVKQKLMEVVGSLEFGNRESRTEIYLG